MFPYRQKYRCKSAFLVDTVLLGEPKLALLGKALFIGLDCMFSENLQVLWSRHFHFGLIFSVCVVI